MCVCVCVCDRMSDFSKKPKGHNFENRDIREKLKNTKEYTFLITSFEVQTPLTPDSSQGIVEISLLPALSPFEM